VHPTREDVNPLVLIEAAQFGCPVVSVRDFAIPELVRDGETGVLLDRPVTSALLSSTIQELLRDSQRLQAMSRQAISCSERRFSWDQIGDRIAESIRSAKSK